MSKPVTSLTACVEFDSATQLYVGIVPGLPGAHSQGATLDELRDNMREVIALCLEADPSIDLPRFVGIQQIDLDAA